MNNKICCHCLIIFFLISLSCRLSSFAQSYNSDSLQISDKYLIHGNDGSTLQGTLLQKDSASLVLISSVNKEIIIPFAEIQFIEDANGRVVYQTKEHRDQVMREELLRVKRENSDTSGYCNIYLKEGIMLKDVRITNVKDSTFEAVKSNISNTFTISGINRIVFINHGFWKGFAYGAAGSIAVWTVLGLASGSGTDMGSPAGWGFIIGLGLAIPTGIVSGIISEFVVNDDVYNFNRINPDAKVKRLKYLVGKEK